MATISFEDWSAREQGRAPLQAGWQHDRSAAAAIDWARHQAYCVLCRCLQPMRLLPGADPADPNLRDELTCGGCGLNSRLRAALGLLQEETALHAGSRLYVTEQATPAFAWMQSKLPGHVIGSEFERNRFRRLRLAARLFRLGGRGGIDFQDVTALDFAERSLDAIACFDVLEHVPDYPKVLAEFARVLREGGVLVATFPFLDAPDTVVRARLDGDRIEHLLEPEYHGDPIGGGVLCWYHFGWDVLEACRRSGFRRARMAMPRDPAAGMYYGLWTLVASR